jgi:FkbM family methyltransferase
MYSLLPEQVRRRLSPLLRRQIANFGLYHLSLGFSMDLDPSEWMQNQLRHGNTHEPLTTHLFSKLLERGDTYLDVGAHVGYFTLVARQAIGDRGLVIAIEPQPYNCTKVLRNWSLNSFDNVVVYPAAATNTEGTVTLHNQPASDTQRLSLDAPSLAGDMPQRFAVPLRRLDGIMADQHISSVKLAKIDAEGHELEVVQGLGGRLSDIHHLIIEVYDPSLPRYKELYRVLKTSGFSFRTVTGESWDEQRALPEINLWAARSGPDT